jgi:uncharacterized protein
MQFEWDDNKAKYNFSKHKVRFEFVLELFEHPLAMEVDVSRADEGEERFKRIGLVWGILHTVVYTTRARNIRIISARRSNEKEKRQYRLFNADIEEPSQTQ